MSHSIGLHFVSSPFSGALVYLLDLYCNATNPAVREQTAELFAKVLSDKLVGPKVRIILSKFLPPIFMDAMRDSAEASVHMFEGMYCEYYSLLETDVLAGKKVIYSQSYMISFGTMLGTRKFNMVII